MLARGGAVPRFAGVEGRRLVTPSSEIDPQALLAILGRCTGVVISVVGDVMLDEYVEGNVERISPEAPVPIVRAQGSAFRLGGAANVAQQLAALGAKVALAGVIGSDAAGDTVRRLTEEAGISTLALLTLKDRRTTRKLRVLGQGQQLLRVDWEDQHSVSDPDAQALLDRLINELPAPDAMIVSDYAKGLLTPTVLTKLLRGECKRPYPTVVDPKHREFGRYTGATVATPNLRELSEAIGLTLDPSDLPAITAAARVLLDRVGFDSMLVTLGDRGMLITSRDGSDRLIPALKRAVYDVTGAGDTAVAVLTACLATGASMEAAAMIANTAAGIAVGEIGAVAVSRSMIAAALEHHPPTKLFTRTELSAKVGRWRASGRRVVFTNGCFDLLHPGHL
jgi:D-beta-D-heptose 7-phosphate kinase/D-beta-D-heptose 1-phosphate adenosyltransferase